MNKKLLAGIIAGAVALLAVVFVLCAGIFNWFHWDWFAAKDDPSSQSETVSDGKTTSDKESTASGLEPEAHETPKDFYSDVVSVDPKGETKVEAGKYVVVPVTMTENPGVNLGVVDVTYDANVLEYVDYDEGDVFDGYTVNATTGSVLMLVEVGESDDTTETGKIFTLKFKVKDGAAAGNYPITAGAKTQFSNYDEELVAPTFEIGSVVIE